MASRLVGMAENEADHRRAMERRLVEAHCSERVSYHAEVLRGQICALLIVVTALAIGGYTIAQGHDWPGALLGTGGMGGIVLTFILGRKAKQLPPNTSHAGDTPPGASRQP